MRIISLVLMLMLHSVAFAEELRSEDPWKGFNQTIHRFNDSADRHLLKPIAKGYVKVVPGPVQRGISNFFGNLGDVNNGVNNLLQGKPRAGASDFLRLLINTTIGIGGLFDPATRLGLDEHTESFSQTLAVWGVPRGPYVVLPLFGPSTFTDALVQPVNSQIDPLRYLYPVDHRNSLFALGVIDERAGLLKAESVVFGDRYIFLRDAYLQRRNYLVLDGEVEDDF
jgi:phospholipid-binding lipoprotein MlaA